MVVTIEPGKLPVEVQCCVKLTHSGLYVPPSPHFPKEFHNIGVRIEVRELSYQEVPPMTHYFSTTGRCTDRFDWTYDSKCEHTEGGEHTAGA